MPDLQPTPVHAATVALLESLARALRAEQGDCLDCGHDGSDTLPACLFCGHTGVDADTEVCPICREMVPAVQVCAKCYAPHPTPEEYKAEAGRLKVAAREQYETEWESSHPMSAGRDGFPL